MSKPDGMSQPDEGCQTIKHGMYIQVEAFRNDVKEVSEGIYKLTTVNLLILHS